MLLWLNEPKFHHLQKLKSFEHRMKLKTTFCRKPHQLLILLSHSLLPGKTTTLPFDYNRVGVLLSYWKKTFKNKVPPEWVTKPQDEEVVEGQDITFPCKVTGVPQPTVVWRKLAGKFFSFYFHLLFLFQKRISKLTEYFLILVKRIHFKLKKFIERLKFMAILLSWIYSLVMSSGEKRDVTLRQNSPMCILHFFNTIYSMKKAHIVLNFSSNIRICVLG